MTTSNSTLENATLNSLPKGWVTVDVERQMPEIDPTNGQVEYCVEASSVGIPAGKHPGGLIELVLTNGFGQRVGGFVQLYASDANGWLYRKGTSSLYLRILND